MAARHNSTNRITRTERRTGMSHDSYISGNAVRRTQRNAQEIAIHRARRSQQDVVDKERNRENALRVNKSYVIFMICICVALISVSVNYLQLQAAGTEYRSTIATMESKLSDLRLSNESAYEHVMASIDVDNVKKIAINELGMHYAQEGQIITYNSQHGDYIRQYDDITQ